MAFHPKAPVLSEVGGTDVKRTELDSKEAPEAKEDLASRWKPKSLVEDQTKGSFFSVTGTNQIQGKDPEAALGVTSADRTPPGRADVAGHDPFKDAV